MHNGPGIPVGQFAIRSGPMLAASDHIAIDVTGKGGHAARPHECIDTVLVASHIVTALQSIVARNVDPIQSGVVSICMFHSARPRTSSPSARSLSEVDRQAEDRAQLDDDGEHLPVAVGERDAGERLEDAEVGGRADRKELRQALDETQQHGQQEIVESSPPPRLRLALGVRPGYRSRAGTPFETRRCNTIGGVVPSRRRRTRNHTRFPAGMTRRPPATGSGV